LTGSASTNTFDTVQLRVHAGKFAGHTGGTMAYDMIIKNGKVIDGSGLPGFHGDVAVSGGRIIEIGKVSGEAPV
jgi:hypothetical protein